ncbi:MAG TPA: ROK family protein [Candidatus Kryptonia bacterium]
MQTGDLKLVKSINDRLVLNLIRTNRIISSSDLVKVTGMRPSTIFNILNDLSAKSMVINLGKGESTEKGGKKPYLWSLNKDAAYAIGLDFEIGQLTAVVLDFSADIVAKKTYKVEEFESLDELVKQIIMIVDDVLADSKAEGSKVIGMGIAVAGIVNSETGVAVMTSVFQQMNVPFLSALKKHYSFPIVVENNANASAVGDKWVGVAKESKNCMTVLVEFDKIFRGMGIGLIINEELYHGSSFSAGEINSPLLNLREMLDNVRNLLSKGAILKQYESTPDLIDVNIMIDAAKQGDEVALAFFKRLGYLIGRSISGYIAVLNPDMLIISGDIAELGEIIAAPVKSSIDLQVLSITSETLSVVTSSHGHYSVAMGAASIILSNHFKVPNVRMISFGAAGRGAKKVSSARRAS